MYGRLYKKASTVQNKLEQEPGGRKCRKPVEIVPLFITMPAVPNGPESKFKYPPAVH